MACGAIDIDSRSCPHACPPARTHAHVHERTHGTHKCEEGAIDYRCCYEIASDGGSSESARGRSWKYTFHTAQCALMVTARQWE